MKGESRAPVGSTETPSLDDFLDLIRDTFEDARRAVSGDRYSLGVKIGTITTALGFVSPGVPERHLGDLRRALTILSQGPTLTARDIHQAEAAAFRALRAIPT